MVAPEAAVPGKTIAVLVNLHQGLKEPKRVANVTVKLQSERVLSADENSVVAVTSKVIRGEWFSNFILYLICNCMYNRQLNEYFNAYQRESYID